MNANFCPECSQPLNKLDWSLPQERVHYLSCGDHYFQFCHTDFEQTLRQLTLKVCTACSTLIPYLRDRKGLCQSCYDKVCKEWRMDPELSSALLEIIPRISQDGTAYACQTNITIRPYPNPSTYGGLYGGDYAKTEEELQEIIARFNKIADGHREQGMTNIEIKRREPVYVEAQRCLSPVPQVEEDEKEDEDEDDSPVQASLL